MDGGRPFIAVYVTTPPSGGLTDVIDVLIIVPLGTAPGVVPPPVGAQTKVIEPGGAMWETPIGAASSSLRVTSITASEVHGVLDTTSPCTNIARGYTPPDLRMRIAF